MKNVAKRMLLEWKVMVIYGKMTVVEYDIRREAINEMFRRMGEPEPRPEGWVSLRKRLMAKNPDLKIPEDVYDRCYRGKY